MKPAFSTLKFEMQRELIAFMLYSFLIHTVQSNSFRYHIHSDEAQRKFSAIEREGLFDGQTSLLDWVSTSFCPVAFQGVQIQLALWYKPEYWTERIVTGEFIDF